MKRVSVSAGAAVLGRFIASSPRACEELVALNSGTRRATQRGHDTRESRAALLEALKNPTLSPQGTVLTLTINAQTFEGTDAGITSTAPDLHLINPHVVNLLD